MEKGEKVYYIGLLKRLIPVTIIDKRKVYYCDRWGYSAANMEYIIKFRNV